MGAREYLGAISGRRRLIPIFCDLNRFFGAMHASGSHCVESRSIRSAVGKRRITSGEKEIRSRG